MGCISSKLLATADVDGDIHLDQPNHVVSLTSTTYGVLNLDRKWKAEEEKAVAKEWKPRPPPILNLPLSKMTVLKEESPEVIDAWKLMEDLDDETPIWSPLKKPTKPHVSIHLWSPAKLMASPRKQRARTPGKENSPLQRSAKRCDLDPNRVLRPFSSSENSKCGLRNSRISRKNSPLGVAKIENLGAESVVSSSRRSLSPLFDPELLALIEKELQEEGEQIKKVVTSEPRSRKALECDEFLKTFEEKCPPGGENSVVLYTTTLRGIRKTFEDCNVVRSAIEAYDVQIAERDISMDSGYREELKLLMEKKEAKVPKVFVKGRLIGGAEEILKLEEEGKLGLLLEGIPKAKTSWCEGCGGMRFVMCMDCNGSCKVLDEEEEEKVKCEVCNENGLIHCPICC